MKKYDIGFIGCGNMGRAMLAGALDKGWTTPDKACVHTHSQASMEAVCEVYGVHAGASNRALAEESAIIVLAVKPNVYKDVLLDIRDALGDGQTLIAIAPAYSIAAIETLVDNPQVAVARAMPNTPAQIGQGMAGLCFSANMREDARDRVEALFASFGKVALVREDVMAAVGSVSGSSPAFVYMAIEAMAEGAIKLGIPAKDAYTFAAQSVLGAAALVLETGTHPAALRDAVCSAGGTTIAGVASLERDGFKAALIDAMDASAEKFRAMETQANDDLA
ncbi:MAG: pyrroline-5-carboxylate reductase [Peptococcaceae bacterium]|nr:pyrroline-5-carboxylate reductase [Peptococcaceae bacterium]